MSITPQMLAQLNWSFGQLLAAQKEMVQTLRQAQPQTWTMDMLRARWAGFSDDAIMAVLAERLGYQAAPGKRVVLALEEVLAVDEELRQRLAASRLPPSQRRRSA
jgi:hypothetical protein